jgi:predicted small secreted protein
MKRRWKMTGLSVMVALAVTGCNTIAGLGRDVESIGNTVEDAAT